MFTGSQAIVLTHRKPDQNAALMVNRDQLATCAAPFAALLLGKGLPSVILKIEFQNRRSVGLSMEREMRPEKKQGEGREISLPTPIHASTIHLEISGGERLATDVSRCRRLSRTGGSVALLQ